MARRSRYTLNQELIAEVIKRYELATNAEAENRKLFSEDLRFVYQDTIEADGQWDSSILLLRRGRPSYTFNRVIGSVNLVLGDQRQTRPAVRIRAASKDASISTATILSGLVRDIEQCSHAEAIYDAQFKNAVAGGWGAWRIVPDYEDDHSFHQVLRIKDIPNPLTVLWDPEATDPCRGDSMWCIVAERISKEKYNALYPDNDPESIAWSRDSRGWATENEVRIAEYFKKVPVVRSIAELDDGRVVDNDADFQAIYTQLQEERGPDDSSYAKVKRTRDVKTWEVEWYLVDAANVLAGPIRYKWKRIPVIRVPGRCVNIEGKQKCQSLVRHTKDPQRTYNFHRSTMIELINQVPRAPYMVTPKMVKGYEDMWATANTNNRPYLIYDPDPDVPGGKPQREPPPDVPEALVTLAQADLNDIQAATGYFGAALGDTQEQGDRTSGKALIARQRKSDLGSYEFIDNLGKALKLSTECILDMVPTVYDTQRIIRVIGQDGVEKYEEVNKVTPNGLVNSLKQGFYDCVVTIGPSYQTARQENLATLLDAMDVMPQLTQLCPDLIMRNVDSPETDEMVRRLRIPLIQQGIVQPTPDEQKNLPPPPQPNPEQQAQLQLLQGKAAVAQSKAQAAPLEHQKLLDDIVHNRLSAALDAHKAGIQNAQGAVDLQQSQLEGQQSLQQNALEGQQSLQQGQLEGMQGLQQAHQQHVQKLAHAQQSHEQQLSQEQIDHILGTQRAHEQHQQKMEHGSEAHKAKLTQMKAEKKVQGASKAPGRSTQNLSQK
jgi:hypothetical protein